MFGVRERFLKIIKEVRGDDSLWASLFAENLEDRRTLKNIETKQSQSNKEILKALSDISVQQVSISDINTNCLSNIQDLRSEISSGHKDNQIAIQHLQKNIEHTGSAYVEGIKDLKLNIGEMNEKCFNNIQYLKDNFNYLYLDAYHRRQEVSYRQLMLSELIEKNNEKGFVEDGNYLLFNYFLHNPLFDGFFNLGDYVQTLATRRALAQVLPVKGFSYWDRDSLSFYKSDNQSVDRAICVMQGWFSHSLGFLPNKNIIPVWLGSHFDEATQKYLKEILVMNPNYFCPEVGCRDLYTLDFCRKFHVPSYLSRCLTLTFPRRTETDEHEKNFLVDIPESWENLLPKQILDESVRVHQRWVKFEDEHWSQSMERAEALLLEYKSKAKLVITTALHCAAPCVAMGIPVILIQEDSLENVKRFSALKGILPYYTVQDLQNGKINFSPNPVDIEPLKIALLENLKLSVKRALAIDVSLNELKDIRSEIEHFTS